ncbi:MAG: prolyl oligopeptidase family serine peptidase [Mariniphaga sp.]|nr:prolyl oligopeptidase family serine peptidase [Mariniphaga sp.]
MTTRLVIAFLLVSVIISAESQNVIWHEGEDFAGADTNVEQKIGTRDFASGSLALNGTGIGGSGVGTFSAIGRSAGFLLDIPTHIPDAKIIFRYARLQWRETMVPAEFTCVIRNAGKTHSFDLVFTDTKGWGANGPSEWKIVEAGIGELQKGPAEIKLTVNSKDGDITLDGFFIAPSDITITENEFKELSRIKIDNSGYIGINLPFSAIEQHDFKDFDIILRSFNKKTWVVAAFLIHEKDKSITSLLDKVSVPVEGYRKLNINPESMKDLNDGEYTLLISFDNDRDSLTFPFIVLGNTVIEAEKKKTEYRNFVAENEKKTDPVWQTVIDDIKYASDYIENTIGYLRSKSGYAGETERKKALTYFEKARNRSARTFAADLISIMNQTNETIKRMKNKMHPYTGRPGDIRRAFVSAATGKLEPYRIYIPTSYDQKEKIPVMLVLHGGGGDENYYPDMDGGKIREIMEKEGIIMVSPRATSWYTGDGAKDMVQLMDLVLQEYPKADKSQLYSTGVSAGGFGTYNLAIEYPGLFSAVACVSGSSRNLNKIENLKNTPILIIHGGSDPVVSIENALTTSAKLKELGYPHELKVYPIYGHDYHAEEYMNYTLDFIKRNKK